MVDAGGDIAALLILWLTGNRLWYALGSIAVSVMLMVVTLFITREVKAMTVGESADPEVHAAISDFLDRHQEVKHVINLITMQWATR